MTSVFPAGKDSFPTSHVNLVGEKVDAGDINNLADAVNKMQAFGGWRVIDEVVVGVGGQANIQFSSIPQIFNHLKVVWRMHTNAAIGFSMDAVIMRLNGSSSAEYNSVQFYARGSDVRSWWSTLGGQVFVANSSGGAVTQAINPTERVLSDVNNATNQGNNMRVGYAPANLVTDTRAFGWGEVMIPWYKLTDAFHAVYSEGGAWMGTSATNNDHISFRNYGMWFRDPPVAITQVNLYGTDATGSGAIKEGSRAQLWAM